MQTDPVKGAAPWGRGVVKGELILVCPDCQADGTWIDALTRCSQCGSTRLSVMLGSIVCRECNHTDA